MSHLVNLYDGNDLYTLVQKFLIRPFRQVDNDSLVIAQNRINIGPRTVIISLLTSLPTEAHLSDCRRKQTNRTRKNLHKKMSTTTDTVSLGHRYGRTPKVFKLPPGSKRLWVYDSQELLNFHDTAETSKKRLVLRNVVRMDELIPVMNRRGVKVVLCNISPYDMFACKHKKAKEFYCYRDIEEKIDRLFVVVDAATGQRVGNNRPAPKDKTLQEVIAEICDDITNVTGIYETPYETVMRRVGGSVGAQMKALYKTDVVFESVKRVRDCFKNFVMHPQAKKSERYEHCVDIFTRIMSNTPPESMKPIIDNDFITLREALFIAFTEYRVPIYNCDLLYERVEAVIDAKF